MTLTLSSLVGSHLLRGVDIHAPGEDKHPDWVRFQLGDTVYQAVEDGNDGYRSYMGPLTVTEEPIENRFRGVRVLARMQPGGDTEVLELVHAATGKVILAVGTDNVNDWYPCWVASFAPEHLRAS